MHHTRYCPVAADGTTLDPGTVLEEQARSMCFASVADELLRVAFD